MRRLVLFALLMGAAPVALAQRVSADVSCTPTKEALVYECKIALREARTGKPVSGAAVSITADMPSMPMAHQTKPVKAKPGDAPGEYHARIELEMAGEWAVKLNVRGPVRDIVVKKLEFGEAK